MAKIHQYRPMFFDGYDNQINEFNSIDELLNIDWVKNFSLGMDEKPNPHFHKYSISDDGRPTLMAEFEDGKTWYVIGFIDDIEPVKDLPPWRPKTNHTLQSD